MKIDYFVNRFKVFLEKAQKEHEVFVRSDSFEALAVDANTDNLYKGEDSDGNSITPSYSFSYAKFKRSIGQPADRVTLKLEGDFYSSIFLKWSGTRFFLDANDPKTQKLKLKYGDEILGLQSKDVLYLQKEVIEKVKFQIKSIKI